MPDYYLGLMSGTSVDGIDAAVVDLTCGVPVLVAGQTFAWPESLRRQILATVENHQHTSLAALGQLDAAIGEAFAATALEIIDAAGMKPGQITAIGSHGQTLFHAPAANPAFSMQCGDANRIAEITGITTVADFRRRDIAAGGQGAPLVPAFHQAVFHDPAISRAVLNIGGIANLTILPAKGSAVTGFDAGPGNVLLDAWHEKYRHSPIDRNGDWGRSGSLHSPLLEQLLGNAYFRLPPPKSTGRELFCLQWLEDVLRSGYADLPPADVQRTLTELTALSVTRAIQQFAADVGQVLVCGGGTHNRFLMQRLAELLPLCQVDSTEPHGLHPDWVEAVAFAWLAKQTLDGKPGNLPAVTGARRPVVLGAIHPG